MDHFFNDGEESAADQVYTILLNAIVTHILGPGRRVLDDLWASTLHVTTTDVRTAIERLQANGLMDTSDPRFSRVIEFSPDQAAEEAFDWVEAQHEAFRSVVEVGTVGIVELLETIALNYDNCPGPVRHVFSFSFFQIVRDAVADGNVRSFAERHAYRMELARPVLALPSAFDSDLHHSLVQALRFSDPLLCRHAFTRHAAALRARFCEPDLPPAS